MFYVFDLDGTLADCAHRRHLADVGDWRGFFAACVDDPPIMPAIRLLKTLLKAGHRVEVWSGRSDEVRSETRQWLQIECGFSGPLIMRTAGDKRPDEEVKLGFLRMTDMPDIIFDDRRRVVEMWRREGLTCFQVAEGEF